MIYPARAQTKVQSNTNGLDQICVMSVEMKEATRCPAKSLRTNKEIGYRTLAENVVAFHQIGYMPMDINIHCLNDGHDLAETLMSHRAAWHVSCLTK